MTKKALLLYSTVNGRTLEVITKIAEQLTDVEYDLYNLDQLPAINWDDYSTVLIGASIRYGYFRKNVYRFVNNNLAILANKKSAFFGICVTARKPGKDTPEGNAYIRKFFEKVSWKPDLKGAFAGALHYPKYGIFDRTMIRFIMRMGGEKHHEMSKEYSYTKWEKVEEFAKQFNGLVTYR